MPDPYSTTIYVVDKQFVPGSEAGEILSIELSPGGFSFTILDTSHEAFRLLTRGSWPAEQPLEVLVPAWLAAIPDHWPYLLAERQRTNIAVFTPGLTLIPEPYYKTDRQDQLAGFCNEGANGGVVRADYLNALKAYGLYALPLQLLSGLQSHFPGHKLKHSAGVLIESVIQAVRSARFDADLFLHFRAGYFEVILLERQELLYYRAFNHQTFDDVLYYLFYVLEQFRLDPNKTSMVCAGDIAAGSDELTRLSSFFANVDFAPRCNAYGYCKEFDELPEHCCYNLLNLTVCE